MKSKRGRPKKVNAKDCTLTVRLTKKDMGRLRILAEEKDVSLSEMISRLIKICWEL